MPNPPRRYFYHFSGGQGIYQEYFKNFRRKNSCSVSVGLVTMVVEAVFPKKVLTNTNPNLPLLTVAEKIIFSPGWPFSNADLSSIPNNVFV
jgi:hypothetical protein